MQKTLIRYVSALTAHSVPSAIAYGARLSLLLALVVASLVEVSAAVVPVDSDASAIAPGHCTDNDNCLPENTVKPLPNNDNMPIPDKAPDDQAESDVTSGAWITIDEPGNFALLAMGIFGLLFGRWATRKRAIRRPQKNADDSR